MTSEIRRCPTSPPTAAAANPARPQPACHAHAQQVGHHTSDVVAAAVAVAVVVAVVLPNKKQLRTQVTDTCDLRD